jgi:hypothetical protein
MPIRCCSSDQLVGHEERIDGAQLLKILHTYALLFRGASLVWGGNESWPTAVDPRRETSSALSADEVGGALPGCQSAITP